jgi:hypothetical protein
MIYSIKRIIDINILNKLISSLKRKKESDENEKSKTSLNDDDSHFNFANSAITEKMKRSFDKDDSK